MPSFFSVHRRFPVASLAMLVLATRVNAQRPLGSERQDIRNFGGDIWSTWTSPAHMTTRDAEITAGVVGAAAAVSFADSAVWNWMHTHEATAVMRATGPIREKFGVHLYELGSGQYLLPLSGALYIGGRLSHRADVRDAGLGCAAGHLASLGVRSITYRIVSRARPRITPKPHEFAVPGSKDWFHQSFFSGHIANSMACASFFGHRYSLGLVEPALYAYSGAIGIGRLADGEHWMSDTMMGAMVGFALGKTIADRQLHRARAFAPPAGAATIRVPIVAWTF